jgi:hypothetical protein
MKITPFVPLILRGMEEERTLISKGGCAGLNL